MQYKGKLYGKVGGQFFPLLNTTDDWEKMKNRIKELETENEALKQANGLGYEAWRIRSHNLPTN